MKKLNKILAFALTLALCINLCVPAYAAVDDSVPEEHIKAIENALLGISPEKEVYGLGDVDFSNLWIGNEIPKYEFTNNGLCKIEEFLTYPILDENEKIVALANISRDDVETSASVSCELAETLNDYLGHENTEICLVYDNASVYCWNGKTQTKLFDYFEIIDIRSKASWDNFSQIHDIKTSKICKNVLLYASGWINPIGYEDEVIYRNVEKIPQPTGSGWCWAACMACVINYHKGTDYDAEGIADYYKVGFHDGKSLEEIADGLFYDFGLDYWGLWNDYGDLPSYAAFKSLDYNYPPIGCFTTGGTNHAVVIRGVDNQASRFSFMDPATGTYQSGSINHIASGVAHFTYIDSLTGMRLLMYGIIVLTAAKY